MLEKVVCLFERLVVAQENIAANQAAYLEFQKSLSTETVYVAAPEEPTKEEKPKATKAKKEKPVEPEAPKAEEVKQPEPTKPQATLADVKTAVSTYADARLKAGATDPKGDARALMAHFGGGAAKTDAIGEEYWQDVIDACTSGWTPVPAKDEEL